VRLDPLDELLESEEDVRAARDVGVDREGEDWSRASGEKSAGRGAVGGVSAAVEGCESGRKERTEPVVFAVEVSEVTV